MDNETEKKIKEFTNGSTSEDIDNFMQSACEFFNVDRIFIATLSTESGKGCLFGNLSENRIKDIFYRMLTEKQKLELFLDLGFELKEKIESVDKHNE